MTRTQVLILALAASFLATFFASCCCCCCHPKHGSHPEIDQTSSSQEVTGTFEPAASDGSSGSNAHATGTFNHSTSRVVYDVEVDYSRLPSMIQVWSAPSTAPTDFMIPLYEIPSPPPAAPGPFSGPSSGTWTQTIEGPYDGYHTYKMRVKVSYVDTTFPPTIYRAVFTGILEPVDG